MAVTMQTEVLFDSQFFRRRERQSPLAVEQFFQPFVLGAFLAADDSRRDELARLTPRPATAQPVFPTD